MANVSKAIVVLDDHPLRGAAIAAILSRQPEGLRAAVAQIGTHEVADSGGSLPAAEIAACVYVIGGASIGDPQVLQTLQHCLAVLKERPLVVLADEIDAAGINMAIALGIHGVIPTRMTSDVALAAVQFILAGGHYYPHTMAQPRPLPVPSECPLASARAGTVAFQDGCPALTRPPFLPAPGAPEHSRSPIVAGGQEEERCVEVRVGERKLLLTPRQVDVMHSLERGLSNKEIGQELDLSESTVKLHVRHLLRKLGVSNRTQIALLASSALV